MAEAGKTPERLQEALDRGALKRLPLTFLPYVNQQIHQWEFLFPNESRSVERLLFYVAGLSEQESTGLFEDVVHLEDKMGVRHWQFSTAEQTIQNSSQLARSPYFQEWRTAVQAVFDKADRSMKLSDGATAIDRRRLVLLDIPAALPVDAARVWRRWQGLGHSVSLDLEKTGQARDAMGILLHGVPTSDSRGLLHAARTETNVAAADTWIIDAGDGNMADSEVGQTAGAILLSYKRLETYREMFSHEMNTMRKDLADADAVFDRLRKVDVLPWCPPEVGSEPAVREFVRALYLSGNGAVIFGNSFVEWAASEAFRRARPSLVAAKFGARSKPKPFTGVAVFENPDRVNPLPAVDDLEGSAIDAEMLALYVWLAAARYPEYQRSTVCVCIAESISQAYLVAPPEFEISGKTEQVSLDGLGKALRAWIAQD